jgi:glycosyltransferase involved in cell wall biosynthesis
VILDDSDNRLPEFQPRESSGVTTHYRRLDERMVLGAKRNLSHTFCTGDIIVYMDDDDYYPPERVSHALECLQGNDSLIAGSTLSPIHFVQQHQTWIAGPCGKYHATASTFAFRRELPESRVYQDEAGFAEESLFLAKFRLFMAQLDSAKTILCIAHEANTFDKSKLIRGGKNSRMRPLGRGNSAKLPAISNARMQQYIEAFTRRRAAPC